VEAFIWQTPTQGDGIGIPFSITLSAWREKISKSLKSPFVISFSLVIQ